MRPSSTSHLTLAPSAEHRLAFGHNGEPAQRHRPAALDAVQAALQPHGNERHGLCDLLQISGGRSRYGDPRGQVRVEGETRRR